MRESAGLFIRFALGELFYRVPTHTGIKAVDQSHSRLQKIPQKIHPQITPVLRIIKYIKKNLRNLWVPTVARAWISTWNIHNKRNRPDDLQGGSVEFKRTQHTFLFEPALWKAEGTFSDAAGLVVPLAGETQVTHTDRGWRNEGRLRVLTTPPLAVANCYDIIPFVPGRDTTSWVSMNPVLGKFSGRYVLVGDMILSLFESERREHKGMEVLVKQNSEHYFGGGTLLARSGKVSSWSITLKRVGHTTEE